MDSDALIELGENLPDMLRVCVVHIQPEHMEEHLQTCRSGHCTHDVRIVFACLESSVQKLALNGAGDHSFRWGEVNYWTDWGRHGTTELDKWELAELLVKRRRQRLLNGRHVERS